MRLRETVIDGINTNIKLQRSILKDGALKFLVFLRRPAP
jgi:hypothetical protein